MATKDVKFEISLEKLVVKFEGSVELAEKMQTEVTGALNTLASAQNRLIGAGKPASPPVIVIPSSRKPSRRRRSSSNGGIDPAIVEGLPDANVNADPNSDGLDATAGRRSARRAGGAIVPLITDLKSDGLFASKQTNASIREALARKGHTLKSNEVNPVLVSLTRQGILKREKNSDDQWVYFCD